VALNERNKQTQTAFLDSPVTSEGGKGMGNAWEGNKRTIEREGECHPPP